MRFVLSIFGLLVLPGAAVAFWQGAGMLAGRSAVWMPIAGGFIVGFMLWKSVISRMHGFITFEHELTHAIVALLFLRVVTRFVVTRRRGGMIYHTGGLGGAFGNYLIELAPYYFPTITLLQVFLRPLVGANWLLWYDAGIGLTLAYHTFSTVEETAEAWNKRRFRSVGTGEMGYSDIGHAGYVMSGIVIVTFSLSLYGLMCFIVVHGYGGIALWFAIGWSASVAVYRPVLVSIAESAHRFVEERRDKLF